MSTSRTSGSAALRAWAAIGAFCVVFSVVYLHFSYGVTSAYMRWLAAVPLVLGVVLPVVAERLGLRPAGALTHTTYQAFVATCTVGCLVKGILAIADAPSALLWVFPVAAAACLAACAAGQLLCDLS